MVMSIVKRDGRAVEKLESGAIEGTPTVEGVQDLVEETLIEEGFTQTAKAYILYRAERNRIRDVNRWTCYTFLDNQMRDIGR